MCLQPLRSKVTNFFHLIMQTIMQTTVDSAGILPIFLNIILIDGEVKMLSQKIKITDSARKFLRLRNITDVTFQLKQYDVAGCCVGFVKEIEPVYQAPKDARGYQYTQTEACHLFISRRLKIIGPLVLSTEGLFNKRLFLCGVSVPL